MSDFITNGASVLPPVKSDVRVPQGGAGEWAADDCNEVRQALLDTRSEIINIVGAGTGAGSTTPVTANGSVTARTLGARFADVVNVLDHGAVGDGVADDTAAVDAALAAAGDDVVVLFPAGTYLVSARVVLPNRRVRLLAHGATIHNVTSTETFWREEKGYYFEMDGLRFTGTAIAWKFNLKAGETIPQGTQHLDYRIRNCEFLQTTVWGTFTHAAREGSFESCWFENCDGAYQDFTVNTDFIGCHWKNTTYGVRMQSGSEGVKILGGSMLGVGIGVWAGGADATTGLQLIGTMIDYCDYPVYVQSTTAVLIQNCYISARTKPVAGTLNPCVHVVWNGDANKQRPAQIKLIGNLIQQNGTIDANNICVRIEDATDVQIIGNTFRNYRVSGLEYTSCTALTIIGNDFIPAVAAVAGCHSISAGTDTADTKIYFNTWNNQSVPSGVPPETTTVDNTISVTAAVERFGNTGDTASNKSLKGLQVYGGPFYLPKDNGTVNNNSLSMGSGAPSDAHGADGDWYLRIDTPGTASQRIYIKGGGTWTGRV